MQGQGICFQKYRAFPCAHVSMREVLFDVCARSQLNNCVATDAAISGPEAQLDADGSLPRSAQLPARHAGRTSSVRNRDSSIQARHPAFSEAGSWGTRPNNPGDRNIAYSISATTRILHIRT